MVFVNNTERLRRDALSFPIGVSHEDHFIELIFVGANGHGHGVFEKFTLWWFERPRWVEVYWHRSRWTHWEMSKM